MCVAGACQACDTTNSVNFGGHCYYLDGAGGTCDPGYTLGTNAQLQSILGSNPNAWQGLNYKHTVSSNCCVLTGDSVENYGMSANCNTAGPFGAGTPVLSGAGCTNASNNGPGQLTLCVH
jgi:hypothetical protein